MPQGSYRLAQQQGGRGYFAEADVDVRPNDSGTLTIEIDTAVDVAWRRGLAFGIEYGWEKYQLGNASAGMVVCVQRVHDNPVDSSATVMAFVACWALFTALAWQPEKGPTFELASGTFCFPK